MDSLIGETALALEDIGPGAIGKVERKGVLDTRSINTLRARAFDSPVVKENFAGGSEEVALLDSFNYWSSALVVCGHFVELEVIDREQRIGVVVGTLHIGIALGEHELRLWRPVVHVVVGAEATHLAESFLR